VNGEHVPVVKRLRRTAGEFAKFAVVGVSGVLITNVAYRQLSVHGLGPVTSATLATVVAAVGTYLGNRYWSFRARQRSAVPREVLVFGGLNAVGLLLQDLTVAVNSYVLGLGHDKLASWLALNAGIALATLFRFTTYRRFVWTAQQPKAGPSSRDAGTSVPPEDDVRRWSCPRPTNVPSPDDLRICCHSRHSGWLEGKSRQRGGS